jgi:glycosyltransferase involved in cell wall biosynthesis
MVDQAQQSGDVIVVSQLPPPVHGSNVMTRAFLRALDTQSIPWRLIDRRFSKTIGEVGQFSPRKVVQGFGLIIRLFSAVLRQRPRVVVLFATTRSFSFLVDWALSELLRALRVPVALYLHTVGFSALAQRGRWWSFAVRRLLGSAKATVVLDESLAWDIEAFIHGRPDVIGNTLLELPPIPAIEVPLVERDTVLFLSNLIPGKGHDDFLAAAAKCLDAGIDAKFVLAGAAGPSVAAEVNASIARSGRASNISYLGAVGTQEKWALLATARAFVFPSSLPETFGLVLLEAAACGVPIVAYPTGALAPRLAAMGAAYVIDTGNRELLAGAIKDIFESPELGEHLGARARAHYAESLSFSAYAISWSRLLGLFGFKASAQQNSG